MGRMRQDRRSKEKPAMQTQQSAAHDPQGYRRREADMTDKFAVISNLDHVNFCCDNTLRSTGTPMTHYTNDLEDRQSKAEAAIDRLRQRCCAPGADKPQWLEAMERNSALTAGKLKRVMAEQPLRAIEFEYMDACGEYEESMRVLDRAVARQDKGPKVELERMGSLDKARAS